MKKNNNVLLLTLLGVFAAGFAVFAASTPSFGTSAGYGILSSTYTNTAGGTTINGDVGYTTGPAVVPTINGLTNPLYAQAGVDQGGALANLNGQACTFSFAAGSIDLSTDATHGPIGVYTPGVYCVTGAASIGTAGVTLNGNGTYIFRSTGALTTVANSGVTLSGGASSCDVFWTPAGAATLGANSSFAGTMIDDAGITIGSTVNWNGRALAFGGTVSTNVTTLTVPSCAAPVVITPNTSTGGTFSALPLIAITKTPNVSTLSGSGLVTYTYIVTNPGLATNFGSPSLSNVTVVDDKCSPAEYVSGDTNGNAHLDLSESWTYHCSSMISQTTVNTAVASGVGNGTIVQATAQATVVVSNPITINLAATTVVTPTPTMPNAGTPPEERSGTGMIVIYASIVLLLATVGAISFRVLKTI